MLKKIAVFSLLALPIFSNPDHIDALDKAIDAGDRYSVSKILYNTKLTYTELLALYTKADEANDELRSVSRLPHLATKATLIAAYALGIATNMFLLDTFDIFRGNEARFGDWNPDFRSIAMLDIGCLGMTYLCYRFHNYFKWRDRESLYKKENVLAIKRDLFIALMNEIKNS